MIKLIFCGIILVILFKILLNVLNNLTNNIKYVIKEKAQMQEELKQQEIKKQEEFQKRFPEVAKYREMYREKYIEIIKKQKEQENQEELRKKYTLKELKEEEFQKQAEPRRKFPEIEKYREETQRHKKALEMEECRRQQYAQWLEDLEQGKIKMHYETQEEKELYLEKQRDYLYGTADKLTMNSSLSYSKYSMSYIDKLDNGYEFEEYISNLLRNLGYINVEITPSSGDYGADVLAEKNGITYAIQCKWSSFGNNHIGIKAVQEIYSGKTFYNKDRRNSYNKQLFYTISRRISIQA